MNLEPFWIATDYNIDWLFCTDAVEKQQKIL
jgi:hypothetical protein